jgi:hypothetical protein
MINIAEVFEKFDDEFNKFERIVDPPSNRPDLCAFLLLDRIMPGKKDIVSAAEHDEIWLEIDVETFAETATEEDVLTLIRCGVMHDKEFDCFSMFV